MLCISGVHCFPVLPEKLTVSKGAQADDTLDVRLSFAFSGSAPRDPVGFLKPFSGWLTDVPPTIKQVRIWQAENEPCQVPIEEGNRYE